MLNKFVDLLFAINCDSLKLENQTVKVGFRFKVLLRFVLKIDPLLLILFECCFQLCEKLLKVADFECRGWRCILLQDSINLLEMGLLVTSYLFLGPLEQFAFIENSLNLLLVDVATTSIESWLITAF